MTRKTGCPKSHSLDQRVRPYALLPASRFLFPKPAPPPAAAPLQSQKARARPNPSQSLLHQDDRVEWQIVLTLTTITKMTRKRIVKTKTRVSRRAWLAARLHLGPPRRRVKGHGRRQSRGRARGENEAVPGLQTWLPSSKGQTSTRSSSCRKDQTQPDCAAGSNTSKSQPSFPDVISVFKTCNQGRCNNIMKMVSLNSNNKYRGRTI